jgi:putative glutamine amidotransferase
VVAPLIAVPGRLSRSASALRYEAVVNARALLEAVVRAGGEPLTVTPRSLLADPLSDPAAAAAEVGESLRWADGVLLPGGGDLDPGTYRQSVASGEVYDVDRLQDAFDLAVARWALDAGVALLAVCRGLQVVNVAAGGTLDQHMASPHRHRRHRVELDAGSAVGSAVGSAAGALGPSVSVSCYHHQRIERLGAGLRVVGRADDGTPEAVERPGSAGWFLGIQWHPEDDAATDPSQQAVFDALVAAARSGEQACGRTLDGAAQPA